MQPRRIMQLHNEPGFRHTGTLPEPAPMASGQFGMARWLLARRIAVALWPRYPRGVPPV